MACNNFDGCTDTISSDCIKWEGEPYVDLDICINDTLTEITTIILDKIIDILKGRGILLPDLVIEDCIYIKDLLGVDEKNLLNILDVYKQALCDLNTRISTLNLSVEDFTTIATYTLGCLNPLPADPCNPVIRFHTLIQSMITKICELQTQYDSISNSILDVIEDATGNFLQTAIKSCGGNGIVFSGVGAASVVTFQALVPPYSPILYTGTLTYFDVSGVGLANTPMCGWYLCNGANGTPSSNSLPQNIALNLKYIIRFN